MPNSTDQPAPEHPFAQFIRTIGKGKKGRRSLSECEAQEAMTLILQAEVEPVQLGAFLMLLRVKEESAAEIAGFVAACRASFEFDQAIELRPDLDWSSYAGKRRQPPWFLLAALLLAHNGYTIFMHGAKGHTEGRLYTETVLSELGITSAYNLADCKQQLLTRRFTFMPIQQICAPLHDMIELRSVFGLRSPVHTLTRLLNPLCAKATIQSVFHPAYSATHHHAAELLGEKNAAVFKGDGGEVEYRPHARLTVKAICQGASETYTIPRTCESVDEALLSASTLTALWRDENKHQYGRLAVIGTIAIALKTMGVEKQFPSAWAQAENFWNNRPDELISTKTA